MDYLAKFHDKKEFCNFTVDVESVGGVPSINGVESVGASWMTSEGKVLSTFYQKCDLKGFTPDKRCMEEFWIPKMPHRVDEILASYRGESGNPTPWQVLANMWDWCFKVIKEHNIDPKYILKLSDCPSYDCMMIGYFSVIDIRNPFGDDMEWIDLSSLYAGMARYPITPNLIREASSKYMACIGIKDRLKQDIEKLPKWNIDHDHNPANDAINMTLYFIYFNMQNNYCWFPEDVAIGRILDEHRA